MTSDYGKAPLKKRPAKHSLMVEHPGVNLSAEFMFIEITLEKYG